jgi:hypothetical protein
MPISRKKVLALAAFLSIGLCSGVFAYTGEWTQFDWSGGTSVSTGVHPADAGGWTTYYSKTSTITYVPGAGLQIQNQSFFWPTTDAGTGTGGFAYTGYALGSGIRIVGGANPYLSYGTGFGEDLSLGVFDTLTYTAGIPGITKVSAKLFQIDTSVSPHFGVYHFASFNVGSGSTITVVGVNFLVIKATGNIQIDGLLSAVGGAGGDANGLGGVGVCGGGNGGAERSNGTGLGAGTFISYGAGAGGGFGGAGGNGLKQGGSNAAGAAYGDADLYTFYGGSGGSGGSNNNGTGTNVGAGGGSGGGGIQLYSKGKLEIGTAGIIDVTGGRGGNQPNAYENTGGGGGGSGGAILLVADVVVSSGSLLAVGGKGGDALAGGSYRYSGGGGGGGRIKIMRGAYVSTPGTISAAGGAEGTASVGKISPAGTAGTTLSAASVNSAVYTSGVYNTGGQFDLYDVAWSSAATTQSGVIVRVRAGNTATPDGTWTAWAPFANGASLSGSMDYLQYMQWHSSFTTTGTMANYAIPDLTISYLGYDQAYNLLNSNVYDTTSSSNSLRQVRWTHIKPPSTDVRLQVRTSSHAVTNWSSWMGPDGTVDSWFTDPAGSQTVPYALRDGANDRYFQYRIQLKGSGQSTPTLSVSTITYGSLGIPVIDSLAADSSTQIRLNFTDNSDDEFDFRIATGVITGPDTDMGAIVSTDSAGTGFRSGLSTGLNPNTLYFIRLRAHETATGGYSPFSNELSTYTLAAPPKVSATPYEPSVTNLKVYWDANNNPAGTQFYIEGDDDPAYGSPLGQSGWTTQTSQTFGALTPGTTYYFRVKARNAYGIETATAALHEAQPVDNPSAAPISFADATSVTVNWGPNSNPPYIYYKAQRATDAGFTANLADTGWVQANSATFAGLAVNTTYYFRVKAANPSLEESAAWVSLGSTCTLVFQPLFSVSPVAYDSALSIDWNENGNPAGTKYLVQVSMLSDFSAVTASSYAYTGNSWAALAVPGYSVNYGGALAYGGGDYVYAFPGNANVLRRYSISGNSWADMAPPGYTIWVGGALVHGGGDYLYAFPGGTNNVFRRYSISGNSWANMAAPGYSIGNGGSLAYGGGDYIYAFPGNSNNVFRRYSISGDSWADMAPPGYSIGNGGSLAYGGGDYIYAFPGNGNNVFRRYSISGDFWTNMAVPGYAVNGGGALAYGGGDYIYAFPGNGYNIFRRYSISGDFWTNMAVPGYAVNGGGALVYDGGNYVYALPGNSNVFQRYGGIKPKIVPNLTPMTDYYVRISAANRADNYTNWTSLGAVRTRVHPPVSGASAPTSNTVTVNWSNVKPEAQPVEASIDRATNAAFTVGLTNSGWLTAGTTFYTFTGLTVSTQYYFRAKYREEASPANISAWAELQSVATLPNAPIALAPTNITATTITQNWNTNGNISGSYLAECATDAGYTLNYVNSGWLAHPAATYGFTALVPNTMYYCRVKARSTTLVESLWTDFAPQRTTAAVPATPVVSNVTATQAQFDWGINGNPSGTEFYPEMVFSGVLASTGSSTDQRAWPWVIPLDNGRYRLYFGNYKNSYWATAYQDTTDTNPPYAGNLGTVTTLMGTSTNDSARVPRVVRLADNKYRLYFTSFTVANNYGKLAYRETTDTNAPDTTNLGPVVMLGMGTSTTDSASGNNVIPVAGGKYRIYYNVSNGTYNQIYYKETTDTNPPDAANLGAQTATGIGTSTEDNASGPEVIQLADGKYRIYYHVYAATLLYSRLAYQETTDTNPPASGNLGPRVWMNIGSATYNTVGVPSVFRLPNLRYRLYHQYSNGSFNRIAYRDTPDTNPPGAFTSVVSPGWVTGSQNVFTNLETTGEYHFRVKARDATLNETVWTTDVSTMTPTPPVAPSSLVVDLEGVGSAQADRLHVKWLDNSNNEEGFRLEKSLDGVSYSLLLNLAAGVTWYMNTGLAVNTSFYYRVQATSLSSGDSPYSSPGALYTKAAVPAAAVFSHVSSVTARAGWTAGNPAGTQFTAEISSMSDFSTGTSSVTVAAQVNLLGLIPNTSYYARIRAVNGNGLYTDYSNIPNALTAAAPPASPVFQAVHYTSMTVAWGYNINPGSVRYTAEVSSASNFTGTVFSSTTKLSQADLAGLLPSTTYYFRVKGLNDASAASAYVSPAAPTVTRADDPGISATLYIVNATSVTVFWDTMSNSAQTVYSVQRSIQDYPDFQVQSASPWTAGMSSYTVTGLTAGTTYYFRVKSRNTAGQESPAGGANWVVLPSTQTNALAPSALAPEVFVSSINAKWINSNILGTPYLAEIYSDAGYTALVSSSGWIANMNSYLFTGLASNTQYFIRVRASNTSGRQTAMVPLYSEFTRAAAPGGPTGEYGRGGETITVNWGSAGNPDPATEYFAVRSSSADFSFNTASTTWSAVNSYQFVGLMAGNTYYFRVKAKNNNASPLETAWTILPSTTTLPAPVPPSDISLEYIDAASTDKLRVLWNDNSPDELAFKVYESLDGTNFSYKEMVGAEPGTGQLSYLSQGLDVNKRYFYKVSAVNANGEAYTTVASTYTRAVEPVAGLFTSVMTNSLLAHWGPAVNPAGTAYVCELSTMPGFSPVAVSTRVTVTDFLFTGLVANVDYYGRVKAVNGSGVDTGYTELGSTRTIPLTMFLTIADMAPASTNQGERFAYAKFIAYPSGAGTRITSVTVGRQGTGADLDVSRAGVWRDQGGEGMFQPGNDFDCGGSVFTSSLAVISLSPLYDTINAPTTFFLTLSAAENYLSWPGNTIGLTVASTASFTSPNSILSSLTPKPFASGVASIVKVADVLEIFGTSVVTMPNVSRGIYNNPFMKLTLQAVRDRAYLNRFTVNKLGSLDESKVVAIKVFYDANKNGSFEPGAGDDLISSGVDVFTGGQSIIQLVNPSTRSAASEAYFITLDIVETAPLGATIGIQIPNAAAFVLMPGTPDSVSLAVSPTNSAVSAVSDPPNDLMVTPTSMGITSIAQGEVKALEKLEITVNTGNAVMNLLKVQRAATSVDTDYAAVSLYRDNDPAGIYGPSDTFIASGTLNSGQISFGLAENITYTSTRTYFLVASISPSANTSNQAGFLMQAGYITATSGQTTVVAPFPMASDLAQITPTIDTVVITPDASIAPGIASQTDLNVPLLALRMRANTNAADISGFMMTQAGSAADADIAGIRVLKDNGDGLFNPATDTSVSGNYTFSNGTATISFSSIQNVTTAESLYFIAANIAATATPGKSMQLKIVSTASVNILAPDIVSSTFPVMSNIVALEKLPAVVLISSTSLAPYSSEAGATAIKIEKLLIRSNQSTSVMNSISMIRSGGVDSDITRMCLYWDVNVNGVLELSELVSSGTFSGGFLALPLTGTARNLSVSTKTYYVTMDIAPVAGISTSLGINFTNISVSNPDTIEAGRLPFQSGNVIVAEPPSQLRSAFENKLGAAVTQGDRAVLVASITLQASAYTVDMTRIQLLRTGNGYDSDLTKVQLYRDSGNGIWGGPAQETLVAEGVFASGAISLNFSTETISSTASTLYYVAVDVSETAVIGKTFGISMPSASYIKVTDPDYANVSDFPFDTTTAVVLPTVDTLLTVPVPLSLAPLLSQGDYRRSIGKLTLRANAHSVELSGLKFDQTGTIPDADLSEAVLYKDNGDGVFSTASDTLVTFPTQLNSRTLQLLLSPTQILNTSPQTYWLVISVSETAAPGTTLSLDCPNTSYFTVVAPDIVEVAAFPFSFSVAGTLLDKPDTVRILPSDTAPALTDQGSTGNAMLKLKVWTDGDTAQLDRLRVDLSGSLPPTDISAVKLHKDLDSNNVLSGPDLLVASAALSAGYVWLELDTPQTITVSTQTYFVSYDIAPGAAINAQVRAGLAAGSYLDLAAPDVVDGSSLPFTSGVMTIREPVGQVSMNFENKASTWALQGQSDVLMSSFTLSVSVYNAQLTQLIVRKAGTSPDTDISVSLYADNGNRLFGGISQETLVASAAFSGGMATLQFSPVSLSAAASKLFYLAANVASDAQAGKTAGFSLDAANYLSIAAPDLLDPALVFPSTTTLFEVQATIDSLLVTAETLGLVPLLTQGDYRRAVGKLTLRANANSVALSGIKFSQGGTLPDADITSAQLYRDNGDGVFSAGTDTAVTLPTQLSAHVLQLQMLAAQPITTVPQVYWLTLSVATNAAVGATVSLNCANTTYLSISAPDQIGTAPFPFAFALAGSIQDKPDVISVLPQDTAPATAEQGSLNNVMAALKLWTDVDRAVLNRVRVNLTGTVADADIAAVGLYRDVDYSGGFSVADVLLASSPFSGGSAWLTFSSPQSITVTTQTYFVTYDVAATAAAGSNARVEISGIASLDVDSPDTVNAANLPFASGLMAIAEPVAAVSVVFADKAPATALQGQFDVLLASFTMAPAVYNAQFTQLMARRTGNGADSDAALYLYADNGNGLFGGYGVDTFVASAAFSGGMAALPFTPININAASPVQFFLAARVSSGAQPYKTLGVSLDAASYLSVTAPDYLDPAQVFPLATSLTEILPTSDVLIAQAEALGLTPLLTQGDQRRAVAKITLRANVNSVELSSLKLQQTGTIADAAITEALLYRDDGDGVFVSSMDAAVTLPTALSGHILQLVLSPAQAITTAPCVYWLALSVDTQAVAGATLSLTAPDTGYLTVSSPDLVDPAPFPLLIQMPGPIQDKPDIVRAIVSDLAATSMYQGVGGNLMARLRFWTDQDIAVLSRIRVDLTGSALSSEISAVKLYADTDNDGRFNGDVDTLLTSGSFSAGNIWLTPVAQTITVSTRNYFVIYDVSASAVIGAQMGLSVSGVSYFDIDSPDVLGSFSAFATKQAVIRDPRVPAPPEVDPLKGDGTLSIDEVAYNPYETMLKFRWYGMTHSGYLERAECYVGAAVAVAGSPWTAIGLSREYTLSNLDLTSGGTYYLSIRLKNTMGEYYSDIVSRRIVVDSFRPAIPAGALVKDEAGGVKLTWPEAAVGPSGLAHYLIEERRGDSPVWVVVTTSSVRSLVISQAGAVPSSISKAAGSYFYRISPVNNAGVTGEPTAPLQVNIGLATLAMISEASIYPNPFDSRKTHGVIAFTLNRAAPVKISIYDVFGSRVREIKVDGAAGANNVLWDGSGSSGKVSKGVYLCVIKAAGSSKVLKVAVKH